MQMKDKSQQAEWRGGGATVSRGGDQAVESLIARVGEALRLAAMAAGADRQGVHADAASLWQSVAGKLEEASRLAELCAVARPRGVA